MLTIAFCIIALLLGVLLTVFLFSRIINKIFQTVLDASSNFQDRFKTEFSEQNRKTIMEELVNIDFPAMANTINFVLNFAVEKIEEFKVRYEERETELERKQDTQAGTQQETPDNQGFPESGTRINKSKIPDKSVWETTL